MGINSPIVVVGLGNPGSQYEKSRHNAGFSVIDAFIKLNAPESSKVGSNYVLYKFRLAGNPFYMVKPTTFMNLSGACLASVFKKTGSGPANLLVICDNMDLSLGKVRLKQTGGAGGQKGLAHIIATLGLSDFARLFVGIGRPKPPMAVPDYVLGRFPPDEEVLFLSVCEKLANMLPSFAHSAWSDLQNRINGS